MVGPKLGSSVGVVLGQVEGGSVGLDEGVSLVVIVGTNEFGLPSHF